MSDVRIMVVEDEQIVAKDIQSRLKRFGYTVTAMAATGEDAVRRAADDRPDLVLMDIMLKGKMDGIQAADQIRMQYNLPVVYLTAYADDHTLQRAKVTEPFGYVLKPFEEKELQTTIEMALYKHRAEEKLLAANEALEQRVEGRTAELLAANETLKKEVEEHKRTAEALRNSEAQLLQSQKMEAIGRLAGGVAHDFNNNLAVMMGYLDLVLENVPDHTVLAHNLGRVLEAARRSAGLTKQLLLFSNNQPMNRKAIDVNERVTDLKKMLGRLLGEDIKVELALAKNLGQVKADPVNLDQVVTNLAVNARDAMLEGGILSIETTTVEVDESYCRQHLDARPGWFVRLCVADTGTGMTPEVMSRLFEPFFTTKDPDKGTGLGLSVVYGIIQSHEGWIAVKSQPDAGSRFEIYLPVFEVKVSEGERQVPSEQQDRPQGRGERILVIEDEPELRTMLENVFQGQGYYIQTYGTVAEADAALQGCTVDYDLILSDVVLPDGKGTDLVLKAQRLHPNLAAMLMTGYPDQRREWERIQEAGLKLLQKPFAIDDLMMQVREALEASRK